MKEFADVRGVLEARMEAVLTAAAALDAAPDSAKESLLGVLTDRIVELLSTKGRTTTKAGESVPTSLPKLGGRSISSSHYRVSVGRVELTGTSTSTSGEFDERPKSGEPADSKMAANFQVGMPISLLTLRATDAEVLPGPGAVKKSKKSNFGVPEHWRGHDSEVKLLEEIAVRLRPHLALPKNDYAPSAVKSTEVEGSVWLHSDFVICPSCRYAILNFSNRFPNVKLTVTSSDRLTPAGAARAGSTDFN